MIFDAGLAGSKRVVVVQPRRVAARTVAARVAFERKSRLGGEVGYQVRFDDQTGAATRICFVTEGILLRRLQEDPALADIGALFFDEFHERNLLSDVALALAKRLQQSGRPDLKTVVMSATLDTESIAEYLEGCPVLVSEGQSHPVEVYYLDQPDQRPKSEQAADAVEAIVNAGDEGDILVFMPGVGEINETINALRGVRTQERLALIPLHGELPPTDQDRAFASNPLRKIVVATNVAETSVTIDGIRHVVDGGEARIARYDGERGIGTLFIEEISRASADQRKGRAGRTAPGTCHRLWTESGHLNRPERNTPEIQRADLAGAVLSLHSLGIRRAADFDWLDRPDGQALDRAETLLRTLGAIDPADDALTLVGHRMLRLPMHPRYARILVESARWNCVRAAALCAALVSGRDLLQRIRREDDSRPDARDLGESNPGSDFFTLIRAYELARDSGFHPDRCRRYGIHAGTARQVEQTFHQIIAIARRERWLETGRASETPGSVPGDEALVRSLMAGFMDQLCVRRDTGTLDCDMTEGRCGTLVRESAVQDSPLFVAASVREVPGRSRGSLTLLDLATAVKREWVEETFPQHIVSRVEHSFDRTHKRVAAVRTTRFQDLVIHREHQSRTEPGESGRCLAEAHRNGCFDLPLLNHEIGQFIARVNVLCAVSPDLEFPPLDEPGILACLARAFSGLTLAKEAQRTPLRDAFRQHLASEQREWLDELAPPRLSWTDGRKVKLLYPESAVGTGGEPNSPELQVKLSECFALTEHPRIAEGKLPVKLWLCAPNGKRIDSTGDWPAFKAKIYPKIKPGLRTKYPGTVWL